MHSLISIVRTSPFMYLTFNRETLSVKFQLFATDGTHAIGCKSVSFDVFLTRSQAANQFFDLMAMSHMVASGSSQDQGAKIGVS